MPLSYFGAGGIPCYYTVPIVSYSEGLQRLFFDLVRRCQERGIPEPIEPLVGSYSAIATYADRKVAAKLVVYENGRGGWVGRKRPDPDWENGLYVWVRANDEPGDLLEAAIGDHDFFEWHEVVLSRLKKDGKASLNPSLVLAAPREAG
jgi:hypothetical protein